MRTWLRLLAAELPLVRDLPARERPLPWISVTLGRTLPGWVLRVAALIGTGTLLGLAAWRTGMAGGAVAAVAVVGVLAMALSPTVAVAQVAVVVSGLLVAIAPYGPFDPLVFLLIPLAYATVRLAWWAQQVGAHARVELAALAHGLPRGLLLVAGTEAFGVLVFLLAGRPSAVTVLAGGVAAVVLGWLVFARTGRRPDSAG